MLSIWIKKPEEELRALSRVDSAALTVAIASIKDAGEHQAAKDATTPLILLNILAFKGIVNGAGLRHYKYDRHSTFEIVTICASAQRTSSDGCA